MNDNTSKSELLGKITDKDIEWAEKIIAQREKEKANDLTKADTDKIPLEARVMPTFVVLTLILLRNKVDIFDEA